MIYYYFIPVHVRYVENARAWLPIYSSAANNIQSYFFQRYMRVS